jgi:hypothetical protein
MAKSPTPNIAMPSPDTFVKSALKNIGVADETIGNFFHTIFLVFPQLFDYFTPSTQRAVTLRFYKYVQENYEKLKDYY